MALEPYYVNDPRHEKKTASFEEKPQNVILAEIIESNNILFPEFDQLFKKYKDRLYVCERTDTDFQIELEVGRSADFRYHIDTYDNTVTPVIFGEKVTELSVKHNTIEALEDWMNKYFHSWIWLSGKNNSPEIGEDVGECC